MGEGELLLAKCGPTATLHLGLDGRAAAEAEPEAEPRARPEQRFDGGRRHREVSTRSSQRIDPQTGNGIDEDSRHVRRCRRRLKDFSSTFEMPVQRVNNRC